MGVTRRISRARIVAVVLAWVGVVLLLTGADRTGPRSAPRGHGTCRRPSDPYVAEVPGSMPLGHRASPVTLSLLAVLALVLWVNAALNSYRFNVAIAVLGSIPLALAAVRVRLLRA